MSEELSDAAVAASSAHEFSQLALEILGVHNEYRKQHGVPELILNSKLCKFAQEGADKCAKAAKAKPRDKCQYGENIYSVTSTDPNFSPAAQDVVKTWYDEISLHIFGQEKVNQHTLHFTQLIWKETKELGIGFAKTKKGMWFVVANYDPKGNVPGQFNENVTQPGEWGGESHSQE